VRFRLSRGRDHREVLASCQVFVEAGLLDDRTDACKRRGAVVRHGASK
jgi:hypothetical protein